MLPYNQRYVVWDTETTGLNHRFTKPWQISWLVFEGTKLIETQDHFIDIPNLQLSETIKKLTNFSKEKYDRLKQPASKVWASFKKEIEREDTILVGQNLLNYDIFIINSLQKDLGEKPIYSYMDRIYDTRALGVAFQEKLEKPKSNFLSWQYKIINDRSLKAKASQKHLLKILQIPFEEHKLHEAVYDCQKCFEIFQGLKKAMKL
jgi:DNA polymerase III alpha subunit (gram-positive type)